MPCFTVRLSRTLKIVEIASIEIEAPDDATANDIALQMAVDGDLNFLTSGDDLADHDDAAVDVCQEIDPETRQPVSPECGA